jgi:hypothetical protein
LLKWKSIEVLKNNQFLEKGDSLYTRDDKSLAVTMSHGDPQGQLGNANKILPETGDGLGKRT